ncbi:MAG: hypothetical protein JSV56_00330 [Methanomassiliicoccales archaeon]|nr:MAG: hypothetical protein JSV56_00330 [Methanomassiliicoccales archaeon]
MRRLVYPYGKYLLKDREVEVVGPKMKDFLGNLGFKIVKFDSENEKIGTLIIAVNKEISELKKPALDRIKMILRRYPQDIKSEIEVDLKSQRVGIELYLWPKEEGTLLEIFILPYMEHFDRQEIFRITESETEEITDWFLCEQTWERIASELEDEFSAEPLYWRA